MADLPSIRSVMPWWYVGAAVLCSVVAVLLDPVANLGVVLPLWAGVIGPEIRARRRGGDERTAPRVEARVALVLTPVLLGIAALISQVWPFQRDGVDGRVLVGGAVAIAVGGALLLALLIRGALRRRRARDA
ncbi:hypothetical protein [Clavibacter nebraskensis]|uniref:hypothetical protein n=1 Tax=Clavibacter nebraskensis TaxID=31963 RepID=UPI003F85F6D7